MRCDQPMYLHASARLFLSKHQSFCEHCKQLLPFKTKVIGEYKGYDTHYLTEYDLGEYVAREFLQEMQFSSGPVFFLGLRVFKNNELILTFTWPNESIMEAI